MEDFTSKSVAIEKAVYEKIDPADKGALERVVIAGQKFMFAQETHKYMTEILDKPGELSDRLGMGMVDLMLILIGQSKGRMPPQVIIPAATILLAKAGEFIEQTDGGMDTKVFGEALKLMIAGLKKKLEQMSQGDQQQQPAAQPTEQPAAQPAGLINQGA